MEKENCHQAQLFSKYRPWYVKIIYVDIEIKECVMSATKNCKSRI